MYTIAMGIKGRKLEFSSQPRSWLACLVWCCL
jgi:hypothetical protein